MWTYTTTASQGTDVTESVSETVGIEETFDESLFGFGYKASLSESFTTEFTYEASTLFTETNTSSAMASVTGPTCTVVGGACDPQYPPPNAYDPITCKPVSAATAFRQGDSIFLYQDNLFGTFLLDPHGQ